MKHVLSVVALISIPIVSCGPVESPPVNGRAPYSQPSVGQWQSDLHDPRTVADRIALAGINRTLAGSSGTGALSAAYAFGSDPATETFRYIDPVRGFAVDLPYNESWSTGTYVLPPYEQHDEVSEIRFGPLLRHAVNGYQRAYILRYVAARTPEQARGAYEARQDIDPAGVHLRRIGSGTAVVISDVRGDCPAPLIEVPGERFNYVFTVSCEAVSRWPDALERIDRVAQTLRAQ